MGPAAVNEAPTITAAPSPVTTRAAAVSEEGGAEVAEPVRVDASAENGGAAWGGELGAPAVAEAAAPNASTRAMRAGLAFRGFDPAAAACEEEPTTAAPTAMVTGCCDRAWTVGLGPIHGCCFWACGS